MIMIFSERKFLEQDIFRVFFLLKKNNADFSEIEHFRS